MILEFVLIWMLAKQIDMPPVFWVGFVAWIVFRVFKEMVEHSPEMEDE